MLALETKMQMQECWDAVEREVGKLCSVDGYRRLLISCVSHIFVCRLLSQYGAPTALVECVEEA